ncbi:MAG: hypothetical protein AAFU70_11950, partial [Planctomycetota bacterium]
MSKPTASTSAGSRRETISSRSTPSVETIRSGAAVDPLALTLSVPRRTRTITGSASGSSIVKVSS